MTMINKHAAASLLKIMLSRKIPEEADDIILEEGLPNGYMNKMVKLFHPFIHYVDPNPGKKVSYSARRGRAMLGSVSIKHTANGRNELGIVIMPHHQGKGLSKLLIELLMKKHPHSYYDWKCHHSNLPSLRLLQSLGGGLLKLKPTPGRTMLRGLISSDGFLTDLMHQELTSAIERLS